ncbi:hypothetical protein [Nocardia farcinica]
MDLVMSPPNSAPVLSIPRQWDGRHSRAAAWLSAAAAVFFALIMLLWLVMAARGVGNGLAVPLGRLGVAMLSAGAVGLFAARALSLFPRASARLGPPVTTHTDPDWGLGARLEQNSQVLPLILILAGCALYGAMAWWSWQSGAGAELLPFSRDNSGGAGVALVMAIAAAICVLLMVFVRVTRISYEMYPAGIVCRTPLRATTRIGWEEITEIRGRERRLSAYNTEAPVVTAVLADRSMRPRHPLFDDVGEFGIPACILRCDSNLLLGLVAHLHITPPDRALLASPSVLPWFTVHYHQQPAR